MKVARSSLIAVTLCFFTLGLFAVVPAIAQYDATDSESWQFSAAVYLWGAGVDGKTQSGAEVDVEFSGLLSSLEMAFMGSFEARKRRWSFFTDLIYLDVGADKTTVVSVPIGPGAIDVTTNASLDLKSLVLHFAAGYGLLTGGESRLDVIAGARYLDLDLDLLLTLEALGPGRSVSLSESGTVWDGIVGLKGNIALGRRWGLPYYLDIGAGDSDFTWQAVGGISFGAASWVDLALVYRHLEWDLPENRVIDDLNISGPTFGAIFRF